MKANLTHVALHVVDMEASVDFYQRYCGMKVIHERDNRHICWMAEVGREQEMIFVLMVGGQPVQHNEPDYAHLGFAMASRDEVDRIADMARDSTKVHLLGDGLISWLFKINYWYMFAMLVPAC